MFQISILVLNKTLSNSESEIWTQPGGINLLYRLTTDNILGDDSKNVILYRNTTKA